MTRVNTKKGTTSFSLTKRLSMGDTLFDIVITAIMFVVCIVILYPLWFILVASVTNPDVVNRGGILLWPTEWFFGGLERIFQHRPLWVGYRNSLVYMVVGTAINLIVTIPAGYALSRKDLPFRGFLMLLFTFTMFFSGGLIPSFLLINSMGIRDTLWVMVIPTALSVWNLIITRSFFDNSMPVELLEAAVIDGCSDFKFFGTIVLPLSKVIIAVIGLFYAVGHWNSFFHALIFLNSPDMFPLQLILRNLLIIGEITQGAMIVDPMAMAHRLRLADQMRYGVIVVSALPLLIIYPFVQKYFTQGVMVGSLKG